MASRLERLHHVGVVVRELEASIAWYHEHLGFERLTAFAFPGAKVAFIGNGTIRLEMFQVDAAAPLEEERKNPLTNLALGGINHFAIAVDDLDETMTMLKAKGVEQAYPFSEVPDGSGDRWCFIRDNDGILVELYEQAKGRRG